MAYTRKTTRKTSSRRSRTNSGRRSNTARRTRSSSRSSRPQTVRIVIEQPSQAAMPMSASGALQVDAPVKVRSF